MNEEDETLKELINYGYYTVDLKTLSLQESIKSSKSQLFERIKENYISKQKIKEKIKELQLKKIKPNLDGMDRMLTENQAEMIMIDLMVSLLKELIKED